MTDTKPLQKILGVGPSLAQDFIDLGIHTPSDLINKNPETLYDSLQALKGQPIDRCVLYVFRCAVYYAQGGTRPEKLKWWNWKDTPTK